MRQCKIGLCQTIIFFTSNRGCNTSNSIFCFSALYHSLNLSCELILYRSAIILAAEFTIQFRQAKSQKYIQRCSFRLHAYPVVGADISFFTSLLSLFILFFCSRQGGRGWGIRAKNTGGTSNWKHLIAFSLFLSFCFFKSIYFDAQKLNLCFVLICTQSSYVESKETLLFFFETSQFTKYFFHMALQSLQGSKLITMRYKSRAFRFFDFFCFLSVYVFFTFFCVLSIVLVFLQAGILITKKPTAVLFCIFLVYHVSMCLLSRKSRRKAICPYFPRAKLGR